MPLNKVNNSSTLEEKLKKMQSTLRARDERIVALETENAMLYLKLAQSQGGTRSLRSDALHLRRLNDDNNTFRSNIGYSLSTMLKQLKILQKEKEQLKEDFSMIPFQLSDNISLAQERLCNHLNIYHQITSKSSTDAAVLQNKLLEAELARDEAMRKANSERTRRRTLHNTLVELRGNIRVHCRVRPLLAALDSGGDPDLLGIPGTQSEKIINVADEENLTMSVAPIGGGTWKQKIFEFERVYKDTDTQDVITQDVSPLLTSLLDGYNVCIMAYGQTGSGKTHTMLGSHSLNNDIDNSMYTIADEGIIPRASKELMRLIKERESSTESYAIDVSVFEVYNNTIRDLLAGPEQRDVKHSVFSGNDGSQEIPSLQARSVSTPQDIMELVLHGMRHRHEDATHVHAHSSRSHLVVQLNIYQTTSQVTQRTISPEVVYQTPPGTPLAQRKLINQSSTDSNQSNPKTQRPRSPAVSLLPRLSRQQAAQPTPRSRSPSPVSRSSSSSGDFNGKSQTANVTVKTKLQLVDLAGSECVGMSGVTGNAFRETSNINKSLSALADVLQALAEHRSHVPYRNSRLTHMLQDTIGGDAKLLVMLCVSPVQRYSTETLQCLGFGSRARQVARGAAKKRRPTTPAPLGSPSSFDFTNLQSSLRANTSGSTSPRPMAAYRR